MITNVNKVISKLFEINFRRMADSKKIGTDFVQLMKELKCPGAEDLQGKDVDWLLETPAKNLIEWMCQNVSETNCLTEDEAKRWAKFPKEEVLTGEKLQDALLEIEEESKNVPQDFDEVREELEMRQLCIDELNRVKSNLANHQGRISLSLSNLKKKLETSESNLANEQRKLLKLNSELDDSLESLKEITHEVMVFDGYLMEHDLTPLFEENEKVRVKICQLIHQRFDKNLGRDFNEFEDLVSEIHRLRFSIQKVEKQRILSEAKLQGAKESLEETKNQLKLLAQDMLPKDNIEHEIAKGEKEVQKLQIELKSHAHDILPQVIEEQVAKKCSKILSEDLSGKIERQKFVICHLDQILELLLELTTCQEILGSFIQHESKNLKNLEMSLHDIKDNIEKAETDLHEEKVKVKNLQEKESLLKRNTLVPWDKSLLLLFKMLNNGKELDPSMITNDDIIELLEKLDRNHESIGEKIHLQTRNWTTKRDEIRSLLHKILKDVGISGKSTPFHSSKYQKSSVNMISSFESCITVLFPANHFRLHKVGKSRL